MTPSLSTAGLLDQLGRIVSVIKRSCPIFEQYIVPHGEACDNQDFRSIGLSCAFMAFVAAGGDMDHPEEFDWDTRWHDVLVGATKRLGKELSQGARGGTRRKRLSVDEQPGLMNSLTPSEFQDPFIQEPIQAVMKLLQDKLSPDDWHLLERVYLDDISCVDLAETPEYPMEAGSLRRRVSRARARAREVLELDAVPRLEAI